MTVCAPYTMRRGAKGQAVATQERIRVRGKETTQYIDPRCQWQGASATPCGGQIHRRTVAITFPVERIYEIAICAEHDTAYTVAASKAGKLQ